MADRKISQLVSATTPLSGNEQVPVVQGGATLKTTAQDIADLYVQTTPTLQQVTDAGNTTTDDITVQDANFSGNQGVSLQTNTSTFGGAQVVVYEDSLNTEHRILNNRTIFEGEGNTLTISRPLLGSSYTLTYPTTGGFFAVSVNGVTASSAGNVEIGGGEDTQVVFGSGSVFSGSTNLTYDYTNNSLKLTGSLNLTGSITVTGSLSLTGSVYIRNLATSSNLHTVTYNTSSGQLHYNRREFLYLDTNTYSASLFGGGLDYTLVSRSLEIYVDGPMAWCTFKHQLRIIDNTGVFSLQDPGIGSLGLSFYLNPSPISLSTNFTVPTRWDDGQEPTSRGGYFLGYMNNQSFATSRALLIESNDISSIMSNGEDIFLTTQFFIRLAT